MITFKELGYLGRLGNQLFQVAATVSHAKDMETTYLLPEWKYSSMFTGPFNCSKDWPQLPTYREPAFAYNPIPGVIGKNLSGYFQSHKYFQNNIAKIYDLFTFRPEIVAEVTSFIKTNCGGRTSVSVHVRRTDYISMSHYYHQLDLDWYKTAFSLFRGDIHFFVMSDDINWCKQAMKGMAPNMTFSNYDEIHDLALGAYCDHNIMANSSFSYWQQMLNRKEDKQVIAPLNWFKPVANHDTKDLYLQNWILI